MQATKDRGVVFVSPDDSPSIGTAEAAAFWGVSPKHVRDMANDGRLEAMGIAFVRVGKVFRLSRRDVYAALGIGADAYGVTAR